MHTTGNLAESVPDFQSFWLLCPALQMGGEFTKSRESVRHHIAAQSPPCRKNLETPIPVRTAHPLLCASDVLKRAGSNHSVAYYLARFRLHLLLRMNADWMRASVDSCNISRPPLSMESKMVISDQH
jgi:hypothetical protein